MWCQDYCYGPTSVVGFEQNVPNNGDGHDQKQAACTRTSLPLIQILMHFAFGELSFFSGDFVDEKRGLFGAEIRHIRTGDGADQAVDGLQSARGAPVVRLVFDPAN